MPPRKRRTGPGHPDHRGRTTVPPRPAVLPRPGELEPRPSGQRSTSVPAASARYTPPRRTVRFRPPWHKVLGAVLLVVGVVMAAVNDAMLLGGVPTWLLPGGHNEIYRYTGIALAASSTWWFGWFDRAR